MPTTTTTTVDPALLARLPHVHTSGGDGFDFLTDLTPCWQPIPIWGQHGWPLGSWRHRIVCHFSDVSQRLFAALTYTDGQLHVDAYRSRHERDTATDTIAAAWWRTGHTDAYPDDLPPDGGLLPHHRGPTKSLRRTIIYTHSATTDQATALLQHGRDRAAWWHYSIVGEHADHTPDDHTNLRAALTAITNGAANILLTPTLGDLAGEHGTSGEVIAGLRDRGGRVEAFIDYPTRHDRRAA